MRLRRKSRVTAEVATHSLNDIMFFLMLFFLIVATIGSTSAIRLMLPRAKSAQVVSKKSIVLSVTTDKQYFLNDKPVNYNQLETSILAETQNLTDPTIVLRADNSLTIQDLVNVMQIGAKNNVKMILATKQEK